MSEVSLESLLGKTEEQAKQEYKKGLIDNLKSKIVLPLLKPGLSKEDVKNTLAENSKNGYNAVITLPSYVAEIEKNKVSLSTKVGVVIGYPIAENLLNNTLREIKSWAKSGIDEIIVVLSLSDLKFNKCKNAEKIIKNLAKLGKKKEVAVMLDAYKLNDNALAEVAKILCSTKIEKVYLSTGFNDEPYEERNVNIFKSAKNGDKIKYYYVCNTIDENVIQGVLTKCDFLVTHKATKLLEDIFAKINI